MKVVNKKRPGFTLTEILVVCGVSAVFLGTAIMLFTNFRQGYSRSENVAVLMQESALFIARLRTDLNNAVLSGPGGGNIEQQLQAFPDHLTFNIYSSRHGRILPVVYNYARGKDGGSLTRREADEAEKVLIKEHVASLAWQMQLEHFATGGSGTFRISLGLDLQLKASSGKEKPFAIKTSLFPARLNRQLNNP